MMYTYRLKDAFNFPMPNYRWLSDEALEELEWKKCKEMLLIAKDWFPTQVFNFLTFFRDLPDSFDSDVRIPEDVLRQFIWLWTGFCKLEEERQTRIELEKEAECSPYELYCLNERDFH